MFRGFSLINYVWRLYQILTFAEVRALYLNMKWELPKASFRRGEGRRTPLFSWPVVVFAEKLNHNSFDGCQKKTFAKKMSFLRPFYGWWLVPPSYDPLINWAIIGLENKTVNSEIVMPDLWRHSSPRLPSDSQKLCSIWDYLDCRFNFNHLKVDYYPSPKGQAVLQEITNLYIIILPPEILYLYFLLFYI